MTRRQTIMTVVLVVVASTLSALTAYRLALRRATPRGVGQVVGPAVQTGDKGCIDFHDAGVHIGEEVCVSGRVLRVFVSRASNTFLDFCADYRDCPFTSVIFSSDRGKFGDLQTLRGREVEVRGSVTLYNGRAEIVIHGPDQIRAAD
jgi:DNA/RNA endonuclease YhcR with UshA esterase domain